MPPNRNVQAFLLVVLVALTFAVPWKGAAEKADATTARGLPEGSWTVTTSFRPSADGHSFKNPVRDPRDPIMRQVTTEQCGGMAFTALDGFNSGSGPSARTPREISVQTRSAESVLSNGARFALWSIWPDRARGVLEGGVVTLTREEELPRLARELERGPVPLGLVRARSLADVGRNHQVVAYKMVRTKQRVIVGIYDPTQPRADDVTLEIDLDDPKGEISEWAGDWRIATWRGLFVERYAAVR